MPHRRAFSVIELLVVITVITVLMGLLVTTVPAVRSAAQRSRAQAIVDLVGQGLAAAAAERVSLPLVQHPFAGTANANPMIRFRRGAIDPIRLLPRFRSFRDSTPLPANLSGTDPSRALWSFAAAPSTFNGITVVQDQIPPVSSHFVIGGEGKQFVGSTIDTDLLLMGNDVLAEPGIPIAYGAKRELLMVLGAAYPGIHRHFLCPGRDRFTNYANAVLGVPQLSSAIIRSSYFTSEIYPDVAGSGSGNYSGATGRQRGAVDAEAATRGTLQSVWERLSKLKGLKVASSGPEYLGYRIRSDTTVPSWQAGTVNDGGQWRVYTIPWVTPSDPWGNELFISHSHDGRIRILSPGRDGCIRIHPGPDGVYQTGSSGFGRRVLAFSEAWSNEQRWGGFDGDDRDATRDNIVQNVTVDDYLDRLTPTEATALGVLP